MSTPTTNPYYAKLEAGRLKRARVYDTPKERERLAQNVEIADAGDRALHALASQSFAATNERSKHDQYVRNTNAAYTELCCKYYARGLEIEALKAELAAEKANKSPTDQKLDDILARLAPTSTLNFRR